MKKKIISGILTACLIASAAYAAGNIQGCTNLKARWYKNEAPSYFTVAISNDQNMSGFELDLKFDYWSGANPSSNCVDGIARLTSTAVSHGCSLLTEEHLIDGYSALDIQVGCSTNFAASSNGNALVEVCLEPNDYNENDGRDYKVNMTAESCIGYDAYGGFMGCTFYPASIVVSDLFSSLNATAFNDTTSNQRYTKNIQFVNSKSFKQASVEYSFESNKLHWANDCSFGLVACPDTGPIHDAGCTCTGFIVSDDTYPNQNAYFNVNCPSSIGVHASTAFDALKVCIKTNASGQEHLTYLGGTGVETDGVAYDSNSNRLALAPWPNQVFSVTHVN